MTDLKHVITAYWAIISEWYVFLFTIITENQCRSRVAKIIISKPVSVEQDENKIIMMILILVLDTETPRSKNMVSLVKFVEGIQ